MSLRELVRSQWPVITVVAIFAVAFTLVAANFWRRGALLGFDGSQGRAHIYRSILEGIALTMANNTAAMEHALGRRLSPVLVSGGGSRSDLMMQIVADVFDRPPAAPRSTTPLVSERPSAPPSATGLGGGQRHRAISGIDRGAGGTEPGGQGGSSGDDRCHQSAERNRRRSAHDRVLGGP